MNQNDIIELMGRLGLQPSRIGSVGGVPIRQPYPAERDYFSRTPGVAGMAAEDDAVVANPYTLLSPLSRMLVEDNEAARVQMRRNPRKTKLTQEQERQLGQTGYAHAGAQDRSDTTIARLLSGDPTGGAPTFEQSMYMRTISDLLQGRR